MTSPELIFRLVAMVLGAGLTVTGVIIGYRTEEGACRTWQPRPPRLPPTARTVRSECPSGQEDQHHRR
jgi:hypothetical protein